MHCVVADKTKPFQNWRTTHPDARARRWWTRVWYAQPAWACTASIRAKYREAHRRRQGGERVEVDHIVPLFHPLVCGLHVASNMRVISKPENMARGNARWPDMPGEQLDLFARSHAGIDFELEILT